MKGRYKMAKKNNQNQNTSQRPRTCARHCCERFLECGETEVCEFRYGVRTIGESCYNGKQRYATQYGYYCEVYRLNTLYHNKCVLMRLVQIVLNFLCWVAEVNLVV